MSAARSSASAETSSVACLLITEAITQCDGHSDRSLAFGMSSEDIVDRLFLPTHDRNDECLECGEDCDRSWLCECCEGVLGAAQDARDTITVLRHAIARMADAIERQEFDRAAHLAAKWREARREQ